MPKSVAGAEPSNQHAAEGEPGYIAPETASEEAPAPEPETTPEPEPEQLPDQVEAADAAGPDEDAGARQWAAERGITIPDGDPVPDYVLQAYQADQPQAGG